MEVKKCGCVGCDNPVAISKFRGGSPTLYCSPACKDKQKSYRRRHGLKPVQQPCAICGATCPPPSKTGGGLRKYCSDECSQKAQTARNVAHYHRLKEAGLLPKQKSSWGYKATERIASIDRSRWNGWSRYWELRPVHHGLLFPGKTVRQSFRYVNA